MKFSIPTEYCLIINAFTQATTLRKAAELLSIDPAVLVRKVKIISLEYGYLEKVGNRWTVTESGRRISHWTEEMLSSQATLINQTPRLRISAYSWLVEQVLIPNYKSLDKTLKGNYDLTFRMAGSNLEQELLSNRSDFVIHGLAPTDPSIAHKKIVSLPWTIIVPYSWRSELAKLSTNEVITFLNKRPYCRHADLSPVTALGFQPQTTHSLISDSVVGLRTEVMNDIGWSAVPAMSIQSALADKKIYKLNLKLDFKDDVSVWWIRSRKDTSSLAKQLASWLTQLKIL